MDTKRLVIVTAAWGRSRLTELMLRHTASLEAPDGWDVVRVCVETPGDPDPAQYTHGWHYAQAENAPLSAKWQAGVDAARDLGADAVMILGSDDFVNAAFLESVTDALEAGAEYVQPSGLWVYDAPTAQYPAGRCFFGYAQRIGAGRTLSRHLLDRLGWQLWTEAGPGRLDGAMDARLDPVCLPYLLPRMLERRLILVDVKTEQQGQSANIWTYDDLAGLAVAAFDPEAFWHAHFPAIADEILHLHTEEIPCR